MSGRRLSDNDIIANWRQMTKNPSLGYRVRVVLIKRVVPHLPNRLKRWLLLVMEARIKAAALRNGLTDDDIAAVNDFLRRQRPPK